MSARSPREIARKSVGFVLAGAWWLSHFALYYIHLGTERALAALADRKPSPPPDPPPPCAHELASRGAGGVWRCIDCGEVVEREEGDELGPWPAPPEPTEAELADARAFEEWRQQGWTELRARLASDPSTRERWVRILAAIAAESWTYWEPVDVVQRLASIYMQLDVALVDDDLSVMCKAGLIQAEERNNGDGEGHPTDYWSAYSIAKDDIDDFMLLGAERWLNRKLEQNSA